MKTYNKEKHFDLDYFRVKGLAYFDTLDFSDVSNEEIKNIIDCGVPEVEFYQCHFKDLDLSGTEFNTDLKFTQCEFKGNTNFEKCKFRKNASFMYSVFNGIANFNYVIYDDNLSFQGITVKPAKNGRFLFLGEGNPMDIGFIDHSITFESAIFEAEACFTNNHFLGLTSFNKTVFANKFWFTNVDLGCKVKLRARFDCGGIRDIDMCYRILKDALIRRNYTLESRHMERLEEKALQKQIDMQQGELEFTKPSSLLTTEEAAEYLKLKPNTLERWRVQYPDRLPFVKIGRTVKYRKEDLQAFITNNRQGE